MNTLEGQVRDENSGSRNIVGGMCAPYTHPELQALREQMEKAGLIRAVVWVWGWL